MKLLRGKVDSASCCGSFFQGLELLHDARVLQFIHGKHGHSEKALSTHADDLSGYGRMYLAPEGMSEYVHHLGQYCPVHDKRGTAHQRRPVKITDARVQPPQHGEHLV